MTKPRVIIADTAQEYITVLQLQFIKEFFEKIELEIITDRDYFHTMFFDSQQAFILIVAEDMYDLTLQKHNIDHIFVMTEQDLSGSTGELNVTRLFKYRNVQEIFNKIIAESEILSATDEPERKETQIIVVTSAAGGVGKTTVATGICRCLAKAYKKVLYMNAGRLQNFPEILANQASIFPQEIYFKLKNPNSAIYYDMKRFVEKKEYYFLLPFKAALISLGIDYSVYEKIALSAKESKEYDFIIVDAENTFDEHLTKLLDIADKAVIVTSQTEDSLQHTNRMVSNLNGVTEGKYLFVSNDCSGNMRADLSSVGEKLRFHIAEHIGRFEINSPKSLDKMNDLSVQRLSYMIL